MHPGRHLPTLVCAFACCVTAPEGVTEEPSAYDQLWSHATLYRDPRGPLQKLAPSGRLQAGAAWFDTDQGDLNERSWRRFRFGFTAEFSHDWAAQLAGVGQGINCTV